MTPNNAYKILIIGLLSIIVIALLPALAMFQHQAEAGLSPISAQSSETHVIPAAAFIQSPDPKPIDYANNWFFNIDDGSITNDSAAERICLVAPVYLPPGSQIESFTAYVQDEFAPGNLTIFLDKTNFFSVWHELAQMSSAKINQPGVRALTTAAATRDQVNIVSTEATYHVTFCLPPNSGGSIKFYGAQIGYLPPNARPTSYLPIIAKPVPTAPPPPTPPTTLIVTNQTGGPLDYMIFGTPQGNISCQIPNGEAQVCGVFTAGSYSFKAVARCGQKAGERTYRPGNDALTPFRCG